MSLRIPINAKCRDCIYDPLDVGTAPQQIACCTSTDCPLHSVRPVTASSIPLRLLEAWRITPDDLCDRARNLVEISPSVSESGQNGQILGVTAERTQSPAVNEVAE